MKNKSPALAVILNAVIPGAGHIYVEKYASAIWYLIVFFLVVPFAKGFLISYFVFSSQRSYAVPILAVIVLLIIWFFGMYSVYVDACQYNEREQGLNKKCPFCAEFIKNEAIKCRYCGHDLQMSET